MTRIETIFGGVLAIGILAVFLFVFFGQGVVDSPLGRSASVTPAVSFGSEDEYVPPQSKCDCYNYAYDYARQGVAADSVDYESQLGICYDKFGAMGAAAFERGYNDFISVPRQRKSCPVGDFL